MVLLEVTLSATQIRKISPQGKGGADLGARLSVSRAADQIEPVLLAAKNVRTLPVTRQYAQ